MRWPFGGAVFRAGAAGWALARLERLDSERKARATHFHFRIRDAGSGFGCRRFLEADSGRTLAPNGRGIELAHKIAFSGLEYPEAGNEVHAWVDQAADHRL